MKGHFHRLLQIMCANGGVGVVLESYVDESGRNESDVFGVAGYAFYPGEAGRFESAWKPLWGGRTFHMTDFVALRGQFEGLSRPEQSRLVKEAVKTINKYIRFGASISCYKAEVKQFAPRWILGMGNAYTVCAHLVMMQMGAQARKYEKLSYIFEDGPGCGEADEFIKIARRSHGLRKAYHYHSHAFVPKSDAVPLQAADMFAWEWTKFKDETLDQRLRPLRQSLRALFEAHPEQYKVAHITGAPLKGYFAQWAALAREEYAERHR